MDRTSRKNRGGYALINNGYVLRVREKAKIQMRDYKVFCFNGEPKLLYISEGLEDHKTVHISFVTLDWQFAKYTRSDYAPFDVLPPKPKNLDQMIKLARILSKDLRFIRVDFYEVNGKVYFGELTFHTNARFNSISSEEYDRELGDFINLYK